MGIRGKALAALLAAAGAAAGCGGDETRTVTVTEGPGREGTASTPAATTSAPEEARAIAEGSGSKSGERFTFRITELTRSGPTVVLNATLTTDPAADGDIQISDLFGDGQFQDLEGTSADEEGDVFDGVALVDAQNRRKYLVARDAEGRCVCTNDLSGTFADPGVPVTLSATLGAPPGGVTQVDVVVPNVKTFTGVPLAG